MFWDSKTKKLHKAVRKGDTVAIEQYCKNNTINAKDNGRTALHIACVHNQLSSVKELMKSSHLKINLEDDGRTPLHYASKEGYIEIILELLREPSLNVNLQDQGSTALIDACKNDQVAAAKELVQCSQTNRNIKDKNGQTAEDIATGNRELESLMGQPNANSSGKPFGGHQNHQNLNSNDNGPSARESQLRQMIQEKDKAIQEKERVIQEKDNTIQKLNLTISKLSNKIQSNAQSNNANNSDGQETQNDFNFASTSTGGGANLTDLLQNAIQNAENDGNVTVSTTTNTYTNTSTQHDADFADNENGADGVECKQQ